MPTSQVAQQCCVVPESTSSSSLSSSSPDAYTPAYQQQQQQQGSGGGGGGGPQGLPSPTSVRHSEQRWPKRQSAQEAVAAEAAREHDLDLFLVIQVCRVTAQLRQQRAKRPVPPAALPS